MQLRFLLLGPLEHGLKTIAHTIDAMGHSHDQALSVDEALERMRLHRYNAILLQATTEDSLGLNTVETVRNAGYNGAIVLLTDTPSPSTPIIDAPDLLGMLSEQASEEELRAMILRIQGFATGQMRAHMSWSKFAWQALEQNNFPAVTVDADGRVKRCNKPEAAYLNIPATTAKGINYFGMLKGDVALITKAIFVQARANLAHSTGMLERDGKRYFLAIQPMMAEDGSETYLLTYSSETPVNNDASNDDDRMWIKSTYNASKHAILLVDRSSGEIVDCNTASESLYARSRDALLNMTIRDLSEDAALVTKHGAEHPVPTTHKHPNGNTFPAEVNVDLFEYEGRELATLFVEDISGFRVVEEALREGARLYRAVVEDQTELICRFTPDGTLTFVNGAYATHFDKDDDELTGTNIFPYFQPTERKTMLDWSVQATPSDSIHTFEQMETDRDGIRCWMRWTIRAIFDHRGQLQEFQGVGRDITERKLAEHALNLANEEKEQYRRNLEATFRSIPDAIITVNSRMSIIATNSAADAICGLDQGMSEGRELASLTVPDDTTLTDVMEQVLKTSKPVSGYETELYSPGDGVTRSVEINCSPLLSEAEGFSGAVLVIRDISRITDLEKQLKERHTFRGIVGKSDPMQDVYKLLEQLAPLDASVLITGESGTGKELVAEALHYGGLRSAKTLVKVNCSALSENLLESELFGHVRGAFTGAVRDKVGRIEAAQGGTIFLDEIGDISPLIQLKLLRFLEQKEYERVGESQTRKADVRIIAATNVDLRALVAEGGFREDLYYRLNVMPMQLPPLRERDSDIPLLVGHFLEHFNKEFGKNINGLSDEVINLFLHYHWPGNIRELKHVLEHAAILCPNGLVEIMHLRKDLVEMMRRDQGTVVSQPEPQPRDEAAAVREALLQAGGNKAKAARLLGVHRATLYRWMTKFGIEAEN